MGDQALMIAITLALGIAGLVSLFLALFWPRRWRLKYRMEVWFVVLLAALAVFADNRSAATFNAYEADFRAENLLSGAVVEDDGGTFDREIVVLASGVSASLRRMDRPAATRFWSVRRTRSCSASSAAMSSTASIFRSPE